MKHLFFQLSLISSLFAATLASAETEEAWKGTPYANNFSVGVMGGLGHVNGAAGFYIPVTISAKILHEGFVPDINDQAHIEMALGPLFVSGGTAVEYSLHLRWDFHKDYLWSFYAIGGVGGVFSGSSLGSLTRVYPRTGVGAMYNLFETVSFRAEFSHELLGLGLIVLL